LGTRSTCCSAARARRDRAPWRARGVRRGRLRAPRRAAEEIAERLPDGAEDSFWLAAWARTVARAPTSDGRSATIAELHDVAARLLSFYGQHEHRRLTVSAAQLEILDRFCGEDQLRRRASVAEAHASGGLAGRVQELREQPEHASASWTCCASSWQRSTRPSPTCRSAAS